MDRRTRKTRQAIIDSFLELKKDREISKISVSEIARLADIGRGTFYTHYKDVYDLQESIVRDFVADLQVHVRQGFSHEDENTIFRYILCQVIDLLGQKREFYHIVFLQSERLFEQEIQRQIIDLFSELDASIHLSKKDYIEYLVYTAGWTTVISQWLHGQIDMEAEELKTTVGEIYPSMNG